MKEIPQEHEKRLSGIRTYVLNILKNASEINMWH